MEFLDVTKVRCLFAIKTLLPGTNVVIVTEDDNVPERIARQIFGADVRVCNHKHALKALIHTTITIVPKRLVSNCRDLVASTDVLIDWTLTNEKDIENISNIVLGKRKAILLRLITTLQLLEELPMTKDAERKLMSYFRCLRRKIDCANVEAAYPLHQPSRQCEIIKKTAQQSATFRNDNKIKEQDVDLAAAVMEMLMINRFSNWSSNGSTQEIASVNSDGVMSPFGSVRETLQCESSEQLLHQLLMIQN